MNGVVALTKKQLEIQLIRLVAEVLGPAASPQGALEMLDRGAFRGSIFEAELKNLRYLISNCDA